VSRGIYFFFEEGELREDGKERRVTRVGTHAVGAGAKTSLWSRLRTHRGFSDGRGLEPFVLGLECGTTAVRYSASGLARPCLHPAKSRERLA
jgi:hypothetical protein